MNKNIIQNYDGTQYTLVGGKLIESTLGFGLGRRLNLASLGKILRSYKTTKPRPYDDQKRIRTYYPSGFAGSFRVAVNGTKNLNIGCVHFIGDNAKVLRKAALKSSKVLA